MTNEWRTLEEIYKEVGKFPFEVEIRRGAKRLGEL